MRSAVGHSSSRTRQPLPVSVVPKPEKWSQPDLRSNLYSRLVPGSSPQRLPSLGTKEIRHLRCNLQCTFLSIAVGAQTRRIAHWLATLAVRTCIGARGSPPSCKTSRKTASRLPMRARQDLRLPSGLPFGHIFDKVDCTQPKTPSHPTSPGAMSLRTSGVRAQRRGLIWHWRHDG